MLIGIVWRGHILVGSQRQSLSLSPVQYYFTSRSTQFRCESKMHMLLLIAGNVLDQGTIIFPVVIQEGEDSDWQ